MAASEAKKQITWAIDSGFTHLSAISAGVPILLAGVSMTLGRMVLAVILVFLVSSAIPTERFAIALKLQHIPYIA